MDYAAEFDTELDASKDDRHRARVVELIRSECCISGYSAPRVPIDRVERLLSEDAISTGAKHMIWRFGYVTTVERSQDKVAGHHAGVATGFRDAC